MHGDKYPRAEEVAALQKFTLKRIRSLQRMYLGESGNSGAYARQVLAVLRRGPSARTYPWMIDDGSFFDDWPSEVLGKVGDNEKATNAVDAALHIYAVHQQSQHSYGVSGKARKQGEESGEKLVSFGRACKLMTQGDNSTLNVRTKLLQIERASSFKEIVHRMMWMVQLMKASKVKIILDYSQLVRDLYRLQYPAVAHDVFMEWGLQFFRSSTAEAQHGKSSK